MGAREIPPKRFPRNGSAHGNSGCLIGIVIPGSAVQDAGIGELRMKMRERGQKIRMRRDHLEGIPDYPLPEDWTLRWYRPGDETHWLEIHEVADKLNSIRPELYAKEFGAGEDELPRRQVFLVSPEGAVAGTATAWWDDAFRGGRWGRVHWVAIRPEYQGKGLGKPLMTEVCRRLVELGHTRAYLTTSTVRVAAIGLYRQFGFEPDIADDKDRQAWRGLEGIAGQSCRKAD